ncbi:GTP cyclohydrolase I [Streptomyces sp. NBC_00439]|uniref:GTP cyclohydrolase I n=1 Tax=unclassified Streptomyces TaxID=2593676 RepID=UPI002259C3B4|nr:GTP cyclohydrolase I FolE [Streptomyces sp. NBC_00439]MCX5103644.1 GTP cyclohydrolase I [Streptomyces sp. NBC_00439]WSX06212.1 GTP cyclohydrolase I [Streptomyces sp. NBC_00987]
MTSPINPLPRPRVDVEQVAGLYRQLLLAVGEDPEREGLRGTPERVARWWQEFIDHDPGRTDTVFQEELSAGTDRIVIGRGIVAWSLCEHHLIPMRLELTIGYRPCGSVLGLSKFARIVSAHTHRLQLQERIVDGVAADVAKATGSADVGVVADGEHLCMSMRGVRQDQARTLSHNFSGAFASGGAPGNQLLAIAAGAGLR